MWVRHWLSEIVGKLGELPLYESCVAAVKGQASFTELMLFD